MFSLNINDYLDKSDWDDYTDLYEELKGKEYHLEKDIHMRMGFKSVITEKRIEIPIEYEIKNNTLIVHNFDEIKKHQKDYHEEYSITDSVISSIIEEFAFSLRYKEDRDELGLDLEYFSDEEE